MENPDLKTLFIARNIIELKEADSTNSYASGLLINKPAEGTVIIAHSQKKGRGRRGASWESEAGKNLTFSMILYPSFLDLKNQFFLSIVVSLGIYDYASSIINDTGIKIKWPNDIYYNDKKLAGILIENTVKTEQIAGTVAGIGLNINQLCFLSDAPNPVSLKQITKQDHDLKKAFAKLVKFIESRYLQLKAGQTIQLKKDYMDCLYRFNEIHIYKVNGKEIKGKITDVLTEGQLVVDTLDGQSKSFNFSEIQFVVG
jgi:BirA family transcriptional regulator, biotin operon repressor / biotin---[acetyl-CoA-carboxylase] ligase